MKLIVGLGNPGKEYAKTRHNVGFTAIDTLAAELAIEMKEEKKFEAKIGRVEDVLLVKPLTFMNRSGEAVARLAGFYKVKKDDLWVIHDDLDIVLGEYKIQKGIGPKMHNGVTSVEEKLGSKNFWRVRVGVDNRAGFEYRVVGEQYVLSEFEEKEVKIVEKVLKKAMIELEERGALK